MRRRRLLAIAVVAVLAMPRRVRAQPNRTVGVLMPSLENDPQSASLFEALRRSLAELGWRDAENLRLEVRWANNEEARARALAQELVALKPDVIVAPATSLRPVREATRSIPVVFLLINDPVGQRIVPNLARPGGNLTGFTYVDFSVGGKLVELVKEIAPVTTRVLVLIDIENSATEEWWRAISGAARRLGLEPQQAAVRNGDEIEAAIGGFSGRPGSAVIVAGQSLFVAHRARVFASVDRERLPAVYGAGPVLARQGGLLSYGVDASDQYRRAASYVDRILKGEKPGDLPVQQPTKYELSINMRTARALGLSVSPLLLEQASEVIE